MDICNCGNENLGYFIFVISETILQITFYSFTQILVEEEFRRLSASPVSIDTEETSATKDAATQYE